MLTYYNCGVFNELNFYSLSLFSPCFYSIFSYFFISCEEDLLVVKSFQAKNKLYRLAPNVLSISSRILHEQETYSRE